MDIFDYHAQKAAEASRPLAERMRPRNIGEFVGQNQVVSAGSLIRHAIEEDQIFSMIFWGPPGCGKTTLARIIAGDTQSHFVHFSAVLSGIKEIRAVIEEARNQQKIHRKRTILFVDEIHRFNKAQQDAFLHHVESGLITLIGATTENPSFEVIAPLLSRCRVITLDRLTEQDISTIIDLTLSDEQRGLGGLNIVLAADARDYIIRIADGDARVALNSLEVAGSLVMSRQKPDNSTTAGDITLKELEVAIQKKALVYDKAGEEHYNLISALHKSLRGSDPDAALYWLARMLAAGEDPFYIARRMVRFASEDIGNAEPYALSLATAGLHAVHAIGMPEARIVLAQVATYLAACPKSNSAYLAISQAGNDIKKLGSRDVPLHLRNAPTELLRREGHGVGYRYPHDFPEHFLLEQYLPDALKGARFYQPTREGSEAELGALLRKRWGDWKLEKDLDPDRAEPEQEEDR